MKKKLSAVKEGPYLITEKSSYSRNLKEIYQIIVNNGFKNVETQKNSKTYWTSVKIKTPGLALA